MTTLSAKDALTFLLASKIGSNYSNTKKRNMSSLTMKTGSMLAKSSTDKSNIGVCSLGPQGPIKIADIAVSLFKAHCRARGSSITKTAASIKVISTTIHSKGLLKKPTETVTGMSDRLLTE